MAEVAPAPTTAMPAKAPKKKAASRTKKSGLSIGELIIKGISLSKERNSVSLSTLKKALQATRYDVENNNHRIKITVRKLVAKGILVRTKGAGASGSFKLKRKQTEGQKPTEKAAPPKPKRQPPKKTPWLRSPRR
ncbi:histone H1-like [Neoarius graeffei]|uniref:histone H1-like n=1 Tax=Neoarius graeffei TaxID=443677 RepID=UPI00298D3914|nr:histone H1-like [Neoarius graeffei]